MAGEKGLNGWLKLAFEVAVFAAISIGAWVIAGMHQQVYTTIPEHYVRIERFNDMCSRLDRIEGKLDEINFYLRATHGNSHPE